jgi:hypothetical protein
MEMEDGSARFVRLIPRLGKSEAASLSACIFLPRPSCFNCRR